MKKLKEYERMYSPTDQSPLNASLGKLLQIAKAYSGRIKLSKAFDTKKELQTASLVLADLDPEDEKVQKTKELLDSLTQTSREIGPPAPPDPTSETDKPKDKKGTGSS